MHLCFGKHFYIITRKSYAKFMNLQIYKFIKSNPAGNYMFKVSNKKNRIGVFIVNFEHISHLVLVFLLLILSSKCRLGQIVLNK